MIQVDYERCIRCSGCIGVCPQSALNLEEQGITCNDRCTECGICVSFCPMAALSNLGNKVKQGGK